MTQGTERIFRYEVPVDGKWHVIELRGEPLWVAAREFSTVEFWAIDDETVPAIRRRFTVVGTGHPLPPQPRRYHGSAITGGGSLVWHLIEDTR